MQIIPDLFRRIYNTPGCVAIIPSIAVIIDYTLTFFLAGNTGMILQWEASPLVRFAVAHNILAIYLIAIVVFYYAAAYAVLRILQSTQYYRFGVSFGFTGEPDACPRWFVVAGQNSVVFQQHRCALVFISDHCCLSFWIYVHQAGSLFTVNCVSRSACWRWFSPL